MTFLLDSSQSYSLVQRVPSPENYYGLREAAGMTPPPPEDSAKALAGTWVAFIAVKGPETGSSEDLDNRTVGMGRLIGDGVLFLVVVDIAIHPSHQRQGLGKRIMQALIDYADIHAPNAYISLVAETPGGPPLYSKFGFATVEPSIGMYRCERVRLIKEAALKAKKELEARSSQ